MFTKTKYEPGWGRFNYLTITADPIFTTMLQATRNLPTAPAKEEVDALKLKVDAPTQLCAGCQEEAHGQVVENQMGHMGPGGCMLPSGATAEPTEN